MLPSLARLSLHSCKSCERDPRPRASVGVPYDDWDQNNEIDCLVCGEPLNADSPDYPWTYDDGPRVVQLCAQRHVYHIGCAVNALVAKLNERSSPVCPECRESYTEEVSQRIEESLLSKNKNPFEPTAVEYWDWENYKIAELKARVASLITPEFKEESGEDEMTIARLINDTEAYPSATLADFLRDQWYYNPTGVAHFARLLIDYISSNEIMVIKDIIKDADESTMDDMLRAYASTLLSSVFSMVSTLLTYIPKLGMITDFTQNFVFGLNELGILAYHIPTILPWEDAMDHYSRMLERDDSESEYDPDAVPGTPARSSHGSEQPTGDDSESEYDPDAVPGTPEQDSDYGDNESGVPETPEQPTPPPQTEPASVLVPESPYARRSPPEHPSRRQRREHGASAP